MAIENGYCTLAEIKTHLSITASSEDTQLELKVEEASRMIDDHCSRHFFQDAAGTRYFRAEWADLLRIDDLSSITTLKTDEDGDRVYETTWAATDYDLRPYDQKQRGIAWTYTEIEVTPAGQRAFPIGIAKGVQIVGTWGWPAVPKPVKGACLLLAARLFKRKDTPFGTTGSPDFGEVRLPQVDPDAARMLQRYVKMEVAAAG